MSSAKAAAKEEMDNDKWKVDLLDAPSTKAEIMEAHELKLWSQITPREMTIPTEQEQDKVHDPSPFFIDDQINGKIALWVGDITTLSCHAIVNTTNETFSDKSPACTRILSKGGPQLKYFVKEQIRTCKTGEAKITKGFDLPARYVIHTVGPKYNSKYHTAAESALYSSYSKVLQLTRENNIKSLGLCAINSVRRGYPPHDGAHIALRTVRRFLENYGQSIELIVFAVEDVDIGIYEHLMPLYFPRSDKEEEYARYCLPKDVGGKDGEPIIPERQIRIADKPMHQPGADFDQTVDLTTGLESSVLVGKTSFAKMQADVDRRWKRPGESRPRAGSTGSDPAIVEAQRKNRYERLLRKAKLDDLTEMANLRCLYVSGEDRWGRPVVVFIGKRFNFNQVDSEKALVYLISVLDTIVQKDYVVIYFHSLTTSTHHPSINFIRTVFDTLEPKYKKNLKHLYIVHPSFWCRVVTWWFLTFKAAPIKEKIFFMGGVEYLNQVISLDKLQVPTQIMDHDLKVTASRPCLISACLNCS